MRTLFPLLLVVAAVLSACATRPSENTTLKQHDLGLPPAAGSARTAVPLRRVEVVAAPVLTGQTMQYRYAADQTTRRLSYADSRWSATPPQLVEAQLSRMLIEGSSSSRCKLSVRLDEFVQVFAHDGSGEGYAAGSYRLIGDRADEVLAQQAFELHQPAPTADAAGGALALRGVTAAMAKDAARWLDSVDTRRCTAG